MKYPWMPLFLGDLLADTLHLSSQEFGAYVLLFCHAWKHEAKVAVKDAQRVARVGNHQWPRIRAQVVQFFDTTMDTNFWYHHRVAHELAMAGEISNKRKDAALQMHSKRTASASILHMPLHPQSPSQSLNNLSVSKVREAQPMQNPGWRPRIDDEVRSPPRTKSDNVLQPIPDELMLTAKRTAGEE